jgi:hypothetical protein
MAKVNGTAVAEVVAGAVLFWSGFKGQTLKTTLTDLLKGQAPASSGEAPPTIGVSDSSSASSSGAAGGNASAPAAPASVSGNVAMGKLMAAAYGWTGAEWNALYDLWERESGWSNTAENSSSGAYGIAQALGHGPTNQYPASYMSANPPPAGSSSAQSQIAWGLSYIKETYGDPIAAWDHEESEGWY